MHVSVDDAKKSEESADSGSMASEKKKAAASSSFVDGFISDFTSVGKVHEQFLDGLADSRIGMLEELPQIDAETFERISDSVAESTRSLYSREWKVSWSKALSVYPRLESALLGVPLSVLPWIVIIIAFAGHHVWFPNFPTFVIAVLALVVCLFAVLVAVKVLNILALRRFGIVRGLIAAAGLIWLTSLMARDGSVAVPYLKEYSADAPRAIRGFLDPVNWTAAMHSAIWIVACAMLGRAVYLLAMGIIRSEVLSSVPRESGGVMSTALIQDRLLAIAYTLHRNLAAVKSGKQASVPGYVRAQVIKDIAKTADVIKGPWVKSVRTGYKQTDEKVERTAQAVAEKIRSWQALVVFGGRNLEVVCDECVRVYLLTVDGDWAAISTEPYDGKKSWLSHAGKVVRKLLALSTPGVSAWIIMSLPFSPFTGYRPIVVGTAILVTLVELLALVDPDIVTKLNTAVSLSGFVSRSPKP
jgi:hypothetical protein